MTEENKYLYLNDRLRLTYDKNQWILETGRKKKNSDEIAWTATNWFAKFSQFCNYYMDIVAKDCIGDLTKLIDVHEEATAKLLEIYDVIIKDGLPTIMRERVIEKHYIEVVKEDKRTKSGYKHIENKVEEKIIKDEIEDDEYFELV